MRTFGFILLVVGIIVLAAAGSGWGWVLLIAGVVSFIIGMARARSRAAY